jgi:hypothetical protein
MKRHSRDNYYVLSEGILTYDSINQPVCERPSTSRWMGPPLPGLSGCPML